MEHRNLAKSVDGRRLRGQLHLALAVVALLLCLPTQLRSQARAVGTPAHVLVFKVNQMCTDTVGLYQTSPGHFALRYLSQTPCTLNLGFGGSFYCKNQTTLIERNCVSLLMGHHRDKIFMIQAAEQTVDGPYGTMRVSMRENAKLFGKWQTYTFHLMPVAVHAGTTILRFNAELGVIGIEEINERCEPIGKVQLIGVDGMTLREFAKQSDDKE